jgi:hypothetical protein
VKNGLDLRQRFPFPFGLAEIFFETLFVGEFVDLCYYLIN